MRYTIIGSTQTSGAVECRSGPTHILSWSVLLAANYNYIIEPNTFSLEEKKRKNNKEGTDKRKDFLYNYYRYFQPAKKFSQFVIVLRSPTEGTVGTDTGTFSNQS